MNSKIKLSISISVVAAILIFFFLLGPILNGIKSSSKNLTDQRKNLAILETKISNLEQFRTIYQELIDILGEIDNLFVDSEVPIEYINFLEVTAGNINLDINILSVTSQNNPEDAWPSMTFQVQGTGRLSDFLVFLDKLENSLYLVDIKSLSIANLQTDTIRASFSVKVFTN
ncbi:MAG: hypothetical protein ABH889_01020 [Candidatus Portnoybacteria bacterium]